MTPDQFILILARYYAGTLSPEERRDLGELVHDPRRRVELEALFPEELGAALPEDIGTPDTLHLIYERILAEQGVGEEQQDLPPVRRINWPRFIAAASIILAVLVAGGYFFLRPKPSSPIAALRDISAPATNRATITLGNGQRMVLDSAASGTLAQQGGARIIKGAGGQVAYKLDLQRPGELLYNTLSNPRGSPVVSLTLSDGTRVWLNAESSIRYPAVFVGNDRTVEMTGEAYFEAAADAHKPFRVKQGETTVEVLGTAFNVNAYADESAAWVTLLTGKVRVGSGGKSMNLQPGQQAIVADGLHLAEREEVNLEAVMAWKNGLFSFTHADLRVVMRQLARWYNVDVSYEGPIPERHFTGQIDRTLTLDQVLKGLTKTRVHYRIEGGQQNRLIIRP